MNKVRSELYCSGCGAEIVGSPVYKNRQAYCCQDCADGKPCECALIFEYDRRRQMEYSIPSSSERLL